jgi:hypothetical protein
MIQLRLAVYRILAISRLFCRVPLLARMTMFIIDGKGSCLKAEHDGDRAAQR